MSRIDSFLNLSPLDMIVSRNVISISEISAVNLIVGWKLILLACFLNRSISCLLESHSEKMSSISQEKITDSHFWQVPIREHLSHFAKFGIFMGILSIP